MDEVRKTARDIAAKSEAVALDEEALIRFCGKLVQQGIKVPSWDDRYHFCGSKEKTVAYLLVLDSLNFCFWPPLGDLRWEIDDEGGRLSGYYGLATALKRALESGVPLTQAEYLAQLSLDQLREILGGQGVLQLLGDRLKSLHELGHVLLEDFGGKAHDLVETAQGSAVTLTRLLTEKLSSFQDTATYQGHQVFFYKRAQIFAADLHGAFGAKDWGSFTDMVQLTAFADYKLPQVLRELGILRYAPALAQKVDHKILLESGGAEEVEIRANTIWAVELIRKELARQGKGLRAFEIDHILWHLGQEAVFKKKPYHRTLTIFY
jgi:hypothetical protein